jgi:hypothetical protein
VKDKRRASSLMLVLVGAMLAGWVAPAVVPGATTAPGLAKATPKLPAATPGPSAAAPMAPRGASPAAAPGTAGKIGVAFTKMTSEALAGNLIGDRARRTSCILLPPGYEISEKRYPVVYVLHRHSGDVTSLVEDFQQSYQAALPAGHRDTRWRVGYALRPDNAVDLYPKVRCTAARRAVHFASIVAGRRCNAPTMVQRRSRRQSTARVTQYL